MESFGSWKRICLADDRCLLSQHFKNILIYCYIVVLVPPSFEDPSALHSGVDPTEHHSDDTTETAVSGEPVRLRCIVHAIPAPQITWYKNGDELPLDNADKYLLSRDGRQLTIMSASVEDTARYTCVARNLAGEIEKNFDLAVHGLSLSLSLTLIHYYYARTCI